MMPNELTPFQAALLDAAEKTGTFKGNHDPFYWDDETIKEYQLLEDKFLALVRKAVDINDTCKISACYFPGKEEVDLTWEYDGKHAGITAKVSKKEGKALAACIGPCVYYKARVVHE